MADVRPVLERPDVLVDPVKFDLVDRISKALGKSYPNLAVLENFTIFTNGDLHERLRKHSSRFVRDLTASLPAQGITQYLHALPDRTGAAPIETDVLGQIVDPCLDLWRESAVGFDPVASRRLCEAVDKMVFMFNQSLIEATPAQLDAAAAATRSAYVHARRLERHDLEEEDYALLTMITAAFDTLRGLCANFLTVLAQDQTLQDSCRARPEIDLPFLYELERMYSSFRFLGRRVGPDEVRLEKQTVPPGAFCFLDLGSANRDPSVWSDPNRFDPDRAKTQNIAFSLGARRCLGLQATRLFLPVFLKELLNTVRLRPGTRAATWTGSWTLHQPTHLPLIVEPL